MLGVAAASRVRSRSRARGRRSVRAARTPPVNGNLRTPMADHEKTILAIDLGTSGPKVAWVTTGGRVLGCTRHPTPLLVTPGGGAEQRPDDWWQAIVAATRSLHQAVPQRPEDVVAVCVTAQWAGTVPLDEQGNPLRNAIIWMDSRGAEYVKQVTGGLLRFEGYGIRKLLKWLRRTGGIPSLAGKEPVAHILYIRHRHPDVYARTYKFLEPKDYINLRLTKRWAASFDSIALHWVTDNRRIDAIVYDDELLALSTVERSKLPELKRAIDVLGPLCPEAADALGLTTSTQVVMGTPDVQSAAIGSGAVLDYEGHVYIGTSSWLTCHVPFKKTDVFHNMASLPSALPGRYFVANAQETAGACIEWLRDAVLFADDPLSGTAPEDFYARLERTAEQAPAGCDKVLFTPWLYGERCPVADATVRAAFLNLSLSTTRAHMVRAVMEGVAFNTRWLLPHVEEFIDRRMDRIRMIGGGASSDLWCQIHADVLDREVAQVDEPVQSNARGAALVAALGLGHLTVDQIPERVPIRRVYEPRARHRGLYDELFDAYLEFYRANKGIYARLNRFRKASTS